MWWPGKVRIFQRLPKVLSVVGKGYVSSEGKTTRVVTGDPVHTCAYLGNCNSLWVFSHSESLDLLPYS